MATGNTEMEKELQQAKAAMEEAKATVAAMAKHLQEKEVGVMCHPLGRVLVVCSSNSHFPLTLAGRLAEAPQCCQG